MTIEQLARTEMELYSTVLDLNEMEQTDELNKRLQSVFASYKTVHQKYSVLAKQEDEALKRGLFIQWYAFTEPSYLTGIGELDENAEQIIIDIVEEKINNKSLDYELKWMLDYYANWDFVFERFKNQKGLAELIVNSPDALPKGLTINKVAMNERGQMGTYWNSLSHFNIPEKNASS